MGTSNRQLSLLLERLDYAREVVRLDWNGTLLVEYFRNFRPPDALLRAGLLENGEHFASEVSVHLTRL